MVCVFRAALSAAGSGALRDIVLTLRCVIKDFPKERYQIGFVDRSVQVELKTGACGSLIPHQVKFWPYLDRWW